MIAPKSASPPVNISPPIFERMSPEGLPAARCANTSWPKPKKNGTPAMSSMAAMAIRKAVFSKSPRLRPMTATLRVYDILARAFTQEGVRTCFALLGDANMNWAARLMEQGCRMIYVRHEHCAVAAAMAYARKTSEVGVATVTCGPGVTQLITALPAAVRASLPLVVFAGEAPLKMGWYNQGINQAPMILGTGADYQQLHLPERMPM